MTSKFLRLFLAAAALFAISALPQTGSSATPSAAAPQAAAPAAGAPTVGPITGTKVGGINIEGAIFGCNEGRKELEALSKKFEPKQNDLKNQNEELEGLKKQLSTQQDKLNPDALDNLKKQIEGKQKLFDRAMQDAQEDFQNQQQEIASKILQKLAPVIVKYAQENGFGMIMDTSKPWPQSNVLLTGESMDITKAVVDIYNVQSGVPAPTSASAPRPAAPKPTASAGAGKPATPATKSTETPK